VNARSPGNRLAPAAIVTGASRGLGAAIATRLAGLGHPVAVNYASSEQAARAVVDRIAESGGTARAYRSDVTDPLAVTELVAGIRRDLGPVGVLVVNATGPQPEIPIEQLTWPDVAAQLDFFVKSPVLLLRAVLPDMQAAGWGRIVHVGSDSVRRVPVGNSAYVAAKSAQLGLAKVWAHELGPSGITVNTVAPGWVPVERHADVPAATFDAYRAGIPAGRFGVPGDVAAVVAFLASAEAAFVNGVTIAVNGGSTIG
jgi:NAD(P)-dependent dehydrogenase (short-subunit alcohol dehydrogenase family)